MEKVIIAVDAGGSKTKICILDFQKNILYTHLVGCGSPAVLGEKALDNIHDGIKVVLAYANDLYEVISIAMGISGLGVIKDKTSLEKKYSAEFNTHVIMENDAILALHSIVTDLYDEGILVLSGTGSAILGIRNNETQLIGGWGHLLTEAGSSYAVVHDFICNIIRRYEDEGVISPLGQKFMKSLNYNKVQDFKILMYQNGKNEVAYHSRFITEQAEIEQDQEAQAIIKKAGLDLAHDVKNVIKALNLSPNTVLGFRGGFITNCVSLQKALINALQDMEIKLNVVTGDEDPVYGAYYMVKRMGLLC